TQQAFREIKGAASIAFVFDKLDDLLLATNTGSLHYIVSERHSFFAFASERFILASLVDQLDLERVVGPLSIVQVPAFRALLVSLRDLSRQEFACVPKGSEKDERVTVHERPKPAPIVLHTKSPRDLKRCIKCLLPETYPFVK